MFLKVLKKCDCCGQERYVPCDVNQDRLMAELLFGSQLSNDMHEFANFAFGTGYYKYSNSYKLLMEKAREKHSIFGYHISDNDLLFILINFYGKYLDENKKINYIR